jgi:MtN3 and saliva related transmembrane protein
MMSMEWAGYVAATMTTLAFVPQALKTIRTRDTSRYVVFTAGIAMWLVYGIALDSMPMILSNIVTFLLSATILGLKLKHG